MNNGTTIGWINSNTGEDRIRLWIEDGRIMADDNNPHEAHEDTVESIGQARKVAARNWSGVWAYEAA